MAIIVDKKPYPPKNLRDTEAIFKFVVKSLIFRNTEKIYYNHKQMANSAFGKGDDTNMQYLSAVLTDYRKYVEYQRKGLDSKRFKIALIEKDFPGWSDRQAVKEESLLEEILRKHGDNPGVSKPSIMQDTIPQTIDELIAAINDEIKASIEDSRNQIYPIILIKQINVKTLKNVYDIFLNIETDDYIKVYEGMPAEVKSGNKSFQVEILEFENVSCRLTVQSEIPLSAITIDNNTRVVLNTVWLLIAIRDLLKKIDCPLNFPIRKLIDKNYHISIIHLENNEFYHGNLDASQVDAISRCNDQDITLIWGPPGTGKSYSLSYFLLNSFLKGEKTLICCTANVAVDSITKTFIKTIMNYDRDKPIDFKKGKVLRLGYTRDPDLTLLDYLFPNSDRINLLRDRINLLNSQLTHNLPQERRVELKADRTNIKNSLASEIKILISAANIVFCTASNVHCDSIFDDLEFDNLIIDEASMMSVPHFVTIAKNIRKRLIIAGDFRQLGPVVLSSTGIAHKWLYKDLFEFGGLKYKENNFNHNGLVQLKIQRRFNDKICQLINRPLYKGELQTEENSKQTLLLNQFPEPGRSISYIQLEESNGYECILTAKKSRYNPYSAKFIVDSIVLKMEKHPLQDKIETVGIITPYRAQVNEINNQLSLHPLEKIIQG